MRIWLRSIESTASLFDTTLGSAKGHICWLQRATMGRGSIGTAPVGVPATAVAAGPRRPPAGRAAGALGSCRAMSSSYPSPGIEVSVGVAILLLVECLDVECACRSCNPSENRQAIRVDTMIFIAILQTMQATQSLPVIDEREHRALPKSRAVTCGTLRNNPVPVARKPRGKGVSSTRNIQRPRSISARNARPI